VTVNAAANLHWNWLSGPFCNQSVLI